MDSKRSQLGEHLWIDGIRCTECYREVDVQLAVPFAAFCEQGDSCFWRTPDFVGFGDACDNR